jgi:hypothetical protein
MLGETEWLVCANPVRLVKRVRERASGRRYLLLACAYALDVPGVNLRGLGRELVEEVRGLVRAVSEAEWKSGELHRRVTEALADRIVGGLPFLGYHGLGPGILNRIGPGGRVVDEVIRIALRHNFGWRGANAVSGAVESHVRRETHRNTRDELRRLCRYPPACGPREAVLRMLAPEDQKELRRLGWPSDESLVPGRILRRVQSDATRERLTAVRRTMADLVRDVLGNPLRRPAIDPAWLLWNHGAARQIAEQIDTSGNFAELPILADALEDAGCCDGELLQHLRGESVHVPGCWALDAVLGRM